MMKSWYRKHLLPRTVFFPYWIAAIILFPFAIVFQLKLRKRSRNKKTKLCIEAGVRGWDLIEFKETYATACEYLGPEQVYKIEIQSDIDYLQQVKKMVNLIAPTHYCYSPRTGSQRSTTAIVQAMRISFMLYLRGITPIVLLSDLTFRTWRAQSAIVTAKTGIVLNMMSPRDVHPIFPHRRLIGPCLMPLSKATLNFLDDLVKKRQTESAPKTAVFVGSLYEPRGTILRKISEGLASRGLELELKGRKIGSPRISDTEYWETLSSAAIVLTTADQIESKDADWTWIQHVIYRYLETLACGTLLVAPDVSGIRRFFEPSEHFVPFKSVEEAIDVIEFYLKNDEERERIALAGYKQAVALIQARTFWSGIDIGLGKEALT